MIYLYSCLTVLAFLIGQRISQKLKSSVLNPFVIALTLVITVIVIGKVPYTDYYQGNFPINNLLGVSVVALALPFYEQLPQIRKKWRQITLVVVFGTCFTMLTGVFFAVLLSASPDILAAIVPKSVSDADCYRYRHSNRRQFGNYRRRRISCRLTRFRFRICRIASYRCAQCQSDRFEYGSGFPCVRYGALYGI